MIFPKNGLEHGVENRLSATRLAAGTWADDVPERELPFPAGTTLGELALLEPLGLSARAVVYRAEWRGRTVAAKVFRRGAEFDAAVLRRFAREASDGRGGRDSRRDGGDTVSHPNLCVVESIGAPATGPAPALYTRTLVRGDSLRRLLRELAGEAVAPAHLSPLAPGVDGAPRPGFYRTAVALFADAADGLARAHDAGVVHGRIHPGNIITSTSGRLVICDFEGAAPLARLDGEDGPSPYLAPELADRIARDDAAGLGAAALGAAALGAEADVFALGAVLFQLVHRVAASDLAASIAAAADERDGSRRPRRGALAGGRLAGGEDAIAAELRAVLARAVAARPEDRYSEARELARDLRRLLDLEPTVAALALPAAHALDDIEAPHRWRRHDTGAPASDAPAPAIDDAAPRSDDRAAEPEVVEEMPAVEDAPPAPRAPRPAIGSSPEARDAMRLLLAPVPARPRSRSGFEGGRSVIVTGLIFLALVAASTWIAMTLHDLVEHYRGLSSRYLARSEELGLGVRDLGGAIEAVLAERPEDAADAIAAARRRVAVAASDAAPAADLETIETRLRLRAGDPAVAALEDPRAVVRIEAIETIGAEIAAGARPAIDAVRLTARLRDENAAARSAAIDAVARAGHADILRSVFPIGAESPPLRIDAGTFQALYRALADAAVRGDAAAAERLDAIDLGAIETVDRIRRERSRRDRSRPDEASAAAAEVALPPNIIVVLDGEDSQARFAREWLRYRAAAGDRRVLDEIERLERHEELVPDVIDALERLGGAEAALALRRMARTRHIEHGPRIIEGLARMGAVGDLIGFVSEPYPAGLRAMALEKAAARAAPADRDRLAVLLVTHADVEIRSVVFEGLAGVDYFDAHPRLLVQALDDAALRRRVLEYLARHPRGETIPALLALLSRSSNDLRVWVVRALAAARDPAALHPLARTLFETDLSLRRAVIEALRASRDDRALPLAVGILGKGHDGLEELARDVLALPEELRREDPQIIILALTELFGLVGPIGESLGMGEFRRAILLAPLGWRFDDFERGLPERARKAGQRGGGSR